MSYKLVKDLDDRLWRKFVAYCKLKGVKVNNLTSPPCKVTTNSLP